MPVNSRFKAAILIVAAGGTLMEDLKRFLGPGKYDLRHAKQTKQAVQILNSPDSRVDLIIVDLEFTGGFALIGYLIHQASKTTKVIAASTFFDDSFLGRLKELGVDDTVQIPAGPQVWRKAVALVLGDKQDAPDVLEERPRLNVPRPALRRGPVSRAWRSGSYRPGRSGTPYA